MSGDVVFSYANEDTDEYAVPARGVNRYEAEKAIRADFLLADEPLEYLGIRVVRIRQDEGQLGRKRRAHVFIPRSAA